MSVSRRSSPFAPKSRHHLAQLMAYLGSDVDDYKANGQKRVEALRLFCSHHPEQELKYLGSYSRGVKELGEKIDIYRFECPLCEATGIRSTTSILPDFLIPYKHYSANEIESVILESEDGISVSQIDTSASESTVHRWLGEYISAMKQWVNTLRIKVYEQMQRSISEIVLAELSLTAQLHTVLDLLPKIKYSGNILGRALIRLPELIPIRRQNRPP